LEAQGHTEEVKMMGGAIENLNSWRHPIGNDNEWLIEKVDERIDQLEKELQEL
jgi:hypothetical protein